MVNIKQLLTKYRIEWRDRGPNCGKGQVNVCCPFCTDDPSFHCAINESSGQYYCFRHTRHRGNNVSYVLKALKIPAIEYASIKLEQVEQTEYVDTRDYTEFRYFTPAEESAEALAYLEARLFSEPITVCRQFNLRISKQGLWLGRLIIPLTIGWTGRGMRGQELRYKAWTNSDSYFIHKQHSSSAIIVEGSMDAMRIASVSSQFDVIAKCRMDLPSALLVYLREANYESIYCAADITVPYLQYQLEMRNIQSYCTSSNVARLEPAEGKKDFGATTESETRRILLTLGNKNAMSPLRYGN